jgi:thioredoxin-related protein
MLTLLAKDFIMRKNLILVTTLLVGVQLGSAFANTTADVTLTSTNASSTIRWQAYSPSVFEEAKSTHHPVILLGKSASCHWCEKMALNTFSNSTIIKLINKSYTPVVIDINKNRDVFIQYKIFKLPTTIIFDTNGNVIKTATGYIKADRMIQILNAYSKAND